MNADEFLEQIDNSKFSTIPYARKIEKPWGWEIHFTPDNLPYMGKILHFNEGARNSLQIHDQKQESWYWAGGNPLILLENSQGEFAEIALTEGQGYTCQVGQKHRLKGGEGGGTFFEVSTKEVGTTFRLEDDYERLDETESELEKRNEEAS